MNSREFSVRLGVIAAALVAGLLHAPSPIIALLGLISLANTGELLSRLVPDTDPIARYLLTTLSIVVSLILLGLALQIVPGQLTPAHWISGWAILSAGALVVVRSREVPGRLDGHALQLAAACIGILAVGTASGFAIADSGVRYERQEPLLELSAPRHAATQADIVVHSVNDGGLYELQAVSPGHPGGTRRLVRLNPTGDQTVRVTMSLPRAGEYCRVVLRTVGLEHPIERELILWK